MGEIEGRLFMNQHRALNSCHPFLCWPQVSSPIQCILPNCFWRLSAFVWVMSFLGTL
jgi:hypothetical protein